MPQKAIPSTTLAAAVRQYLGLSQEQLAAYLGVSRGQVAHVEAGRRLPRAEAARVLRELAARLPPPLGAGPELHAMANDKLPAPRPAEKTLQRQLAKRRWQLANQRVQLARLAAGFELAQRWQALLATSPELVREDAGVTLPPRKRLLQEWATVATDALEPDATAEQLLLMLRIRLLEVEITALEELLAPL